MLVVTANWAIADGTVHGGPPATAVRAFFREVRRAAWRTGFRHDGRYRPLEAIQIILAGDTFDGLTSLAWHGDLRPWQGGPRARAVAERIAAQAAHRGGRLLATLGRLQRDGLAVPEADGRGRPLPGTTCRADVSVVGLVGDRDRVLDGHWFAAVAGRHGIPIGTEWSSDTMIVRHGAECDPLCGLPGLSPQDCPPSQGRPPTLAESLAVDLLVEFARRLQGAAVTRSMATAVTRQLSAAPLLQMPRVIAHVRQPVIREAWQRSLHHWHSQAHATMPEAAVPFDAIDSLAAWLETSSDPESAPPRPAVAAAIDALRPRLPSRRSEPRLFVLGHPPVTMSGLPEAAGSLCLGPAMPAAGAMPATLAFPAIGARRGIWLSGDRQAIDRMRAIHVAPSGALTHASGIVDAA